MGLSWGDVGNVIGKAAPLLGTVLGGPIGAAAGAAGTLIASILDCESTPDAVAAALTNNPEALVKLKEIEANERSRIIEWQTIQLQAELENVKNARAREVEMAKNGAGPAAWVPPATVSLVVTVGFFVLLFIMLTNPPEKYSETLVYLLASLGSAFLAVVNYYLGSSLGSTQKDLTIQKMPGLK